MNIERPIIPFFSIDKVELMSGVVVCSGKVVREVARLRCCQGRLGVGRGVCGLRRKVRG